MATPLTVEHELTIRLMSNGSVQVGGPVDDRMLCYAMLESARDGIHERHLKRLFGKEDALPLLIARPGFRLPPANNGGK